MHNKSIENITAKFLIETDRHLSDADFSDAALSMDAYWRMSTDDKNETLVSKLQILDSFPIVNHSPFDEVMPLPHCDQLAAIDPFHHDFCFWVDDNAIWIDLWESSAACIG